jgi:peptidoglycan-associated lipoprotein
MTVSRFFRLFVMCSMVVAVVAGSGCSGFFGGKKKSGAGKGGPGDDALNPNRSELGGGGDVPLNNTAERGETGTRLTNIVFDTVLFDYDSFKVKDSEVSKIEKVARFLKESTDIQLVIEGNCDERGSAEYNMALSEHRALAVRAYLVNVGVAAERMQTKGNGEEKPTDAGHSEAAWRLNRRAEFAFYR